jgi:hypothetical protein
MNYATLNKPLEKKMEIQENHLQKCGTFNLYASLMHVCTIVSSNDDEGQEVVLEFINKKAQQLKL